MDRLGILLKRLEEQYQQKANAAQMLVITQMIQQELTEKLRHAPHLSSKVAVTMPGTRMSWPERESLNGIVAEAPEQDKVKTQPQALIPETLSEPSQSIINDDTEESVDNTEAVSEPKVYLQIVDDNLYSNDDLYEEEASDTDEQDHSLGDTQSPDTIENELDQLKLDQYKIVETPDHAEKADDDSTPSESPTPLPYNPLTEVPTLAHQKDVVELNDAISNQSVESFNERLRPSHQTELGMILTDIPVKDLKKAIGINDRFLYINELFRGDESMYERSLKTINNFHIFPEAEYWMERELKIKLGWNENQPLVKQFYLLVKRRFSSK